MLKAIDVGSWSKLAEFSGTCTNQLHFSSTGFAPSDMKIASNKFASSEEFMSQIAEYPVKPDEVPIHLSAMGATEAYGPNANGDGFRAAVLKKAHTTFVESAKYYRNHKAGKTDPNFGKVALSFWNAPMKKVELFVIGNKTEEAAKRNNGSVMSKESVEALECGKPLMWSMGCYVSHDVCNSCGNKAPKPSDYCTEDSCRHWKTGQKMPGCSRGLGKVASGGWQQFVDNPDPIFKDISEVGIPADKTAYGWLVPGIGKSAGVSYPTSTMGGADLYEFRRLASKQADEDMEVAGDPIRRLISELACIESFSTKVASYRLLKKEAVKNYKQPSFLIAPVRKACDTEKWAHLMQHAARGIIVTPENFADMQWQRYGDVDSNKLAQCMRVPLRMIFSDLAKKYQLFKEADERNASLFRGVSRRNHLPFDAALSNEVVSDPNIGLWAKRAYLDSYMFKSPAIPAVLHGGMDKLSQDAAGDYAWYKIQALKFMGPVADSLVKHVAVWQQI